MLLSLRSPTAADLPAFRSLLGGAGFGGCFCAVWSSHDETWAERCGDPAQPNYRITSERIRAGRHVGYLVYRGADLVGWTGSGPKPAFPLLRDKLGSRLTRSDDDTIWSIGCIAIAPAWRGTGLAEAVIRAVVAEARARGARTLEAYPTRPWDEARSYRGSERQYERLGFRLRASERDGATEILSMELALGEPPGAEDGAANAGPR